jgi:hypothetical protein
MADKRTVTIRSSSALGATAATTPVASHGARGIIIYMEITAVSGTSPTLDSKVQGYDALGDVWHDITGAVFAQKTGAGSDYLTIYPGIGETSNEAVSDVIPATIRIHNTIGGSSTPTVTFTLGGVFIP